MSEQGILRAIPNSFAVIVLVFLMMAWPLRAVAIEWQPLVEDLRSDNVRFNAHRASEQLFRLIGRENPPDLREKLEILMEDPDHQMRQYASCLLVVAYEREGIPQDQWPEALMRNMVEGLRNDWMRSGETFPNAFEFSRLLFRLKKNYPIQFLAAELSGNDPQSSFIAAILLSRYEDESALPERNEVLLRNLRDDGMYQNAIVAYLALVWSGAENMRQLLKEFEPLDWQQAALVQCAASFHDIQWFPSDDTIREKWLEKARQRSGMERKFAMTALYLDPQGERFSRERTIPEALDRMFEAGRGVKGAASRMKWAAGWFPILDPEMPVSDYWWLFMFLFFVRL